MVNIVYCPYTVTALAGEQLVLCLVNEFDYPDGTGCGTAREQLTLHTFWPWLQWWWLTACCLYSKCSTLPQQTQTNLFYWNVAYYPDCCDSFKIATFMLLTVGVLDFASCVAAVEERALRTASQKCTFSVVWIMWQLRNNWLCFFYVVFFCYSNCYSLVTWAVWQL